MQGGVNGEFIANILQMIPAKVYPDLIISLVSKLSLNISRF